MALQLASPRLRLIQSEVEREEQRLRQSLPLVRRRRTPQMLVLRSGRRSRRQSKRRQSRSRKRRHRNDRAVLLNLSGRRVRRKGRRRRRRLLSVG